MNNLGNFSRPLSYLEQPLPQSLHGQYPDRFYERRKISLTGGVVSPIIRAANECTFLNVFNANPWNPGKFVDQDNIWICLDTDAWDNEKAIPLPPFDGPESLRFQKFLAKIAEWDDPSKAPLYNTGSVNVIFEFGRNIAMARRSSGSPFTASAGAQYALAYNDDFIYTGGTLSQQSAQVNTVPNQTVLVERIWRAIEGYINDTGAGKTLTTPLVLNSANALVTPTTAYANQTALQTAVNSGFVLPCFKQRRARARFIVSAFAGAPTVGVIDIAGRYLSGNISVNTANLASKAVTANGIITFPAFDDTMLDWIMPFIQFSLATDSITCDFQLVAEQK